MPDRADVGHRAGFLCLMTGAVIASSAVFPAFGAEGSAQVAQRLVAESLAAMGGKSRLESVKQLQITAMRNTKLAAIASSEEMAEPMLLEKTTDLFDFDTNSLKETSRMVFTERSWELTTDSVFTPDGAYQQSSQQASGKMQPVSASDIYRAQDGFLANPIRALLGASHARDLALEGSDVVSGVSCTRVGYQSGDARLRICIEPGHRLPVVLEIDRAYSADEFASFWGKVATRYSYAGWAMDASGIMFPRRWLATTGHGDTYQISILSVAFNPKSDASFAVPDEFKASYRKTMALDETAIAKANQGGGEPLRVADGIYMLPGKEQHYNTLLVRQPDGVVVIEAPVNASNSELVKQAAARLFPGTAIKAVVNTSNIWDHIGGLAAFDDTNIELITRSSNVAQVKALLTSAGLRGDNVHAIDGDIVVGSGTNRIVLMPFEGMAGGRMIAAYVPDAKLLYASDMYLPKPWGADYWTEHLWEVRELIDREHLAVDEVTGVSMPPADWSTLSKQIPG